MTQTAQTTITQGVHHAGMTVPDLAAAQDFFIETLGFDKVGEKPDYPAVFLSDGTTMITLWQAASGENARPFERRDTIGMHHIAFRVDGEGALADVHERVSARDDVEIEFAPEPLNGGPTQHMMCYMPGGIRIEFIAPAA